MSASDLQVIGEMTLRATSRHAIAPTPGELIVNMMPSQETFLLLSYSHLKHNYIHRATYHSSPSSLLIGMIEYVFTVLL